METEKAAIGIGAGIGAGAVGADRQPNHLAIGGAIDQYRRRLNELDDFLEKIRGTLLVSTDKAKLTEVKQQPTLADFLQNSETNIGDLNDKFSGQLEELNQILF